MLAHFLRREKAALSSQHSDKHVIAGCDFAHESRETVVVVLSHGIEFLFKVESDDSDLALDGESNGLFYRRHDALTGSLPTPASKQPDIGSDGKK